MFTQPNITFSRSRVGYANLYTATNENRRIASIDQSENSGRSSAADAAPHVALEWVSNSSYRLYTVLPTINETLQNSELKLAGMIDPATNHALLVSAYAAFAFQYGPHIIQGAPPTLSFPFSAEEQQNIDSHTPLACLISPNAGSEEPGLLLAMPVSGKFFFWDTLGSAIAQSLITPKGKEFTVSLHNGEVISFLKNCEPAEVLAATNYGRLLKVSVRDSFGKPNVSITVVGLSKSKVSDFFSGFANSLLRNFSKKKIKIISPGVLVSRSAREVFVCSSDKFISRWLLSLGSTAQQIAEGSLEQKLFDSILALKEAQIFENASLVEDLMILDIAATHKKEGGFFLLSILRNKKLFISYCSLGQYLQIYETRPLQWYTANCQDEIKAEIFHPAPYRDLFIVFNDAIVLLCGLVYSEEMQEFGNEYVIQLESSKNNQIIACGCEDAKLDARGNVRKGPAVLFLTKKAGILRCETFAQSKECQATTLKSKIEEIILFGFLPNSPLVFSIQPELKNRLTIVSKTVLTISSNILQCNSPFLTGQIISMDSQFSLRLQYFERLIFLINESFPMLDGSTRWFLSIHNEKCAAGKALYKVYKDYPDSQILRHVLRDDEDQSEDNIRSWFINELENIGLEIQKAYHKLLNVYKQKSISPAQLLSAALESNDVIIAILGSALKERQRTSANYKIKGISINGIEFWTSTVDVLQSLIGEQEISITIAMNFQRLVGSSGRNAAHLEYLKKSLKTLNSQIADLAFIVCCVYKERLDYCSNILDESHKNESMELENNLSLVLEKAIMPLSKLGVRSRAFEIAEIFEQFKVLIFLLNDEIKNKKEEDVDTVYLEERRASYMQIYGKKFAFVLYDFYINNGMIYQMLTNNSEHREYLDEYLKQKDLKDYLWLHCLSNSEFECAADTLQFLANKREQKAQNARIDLSIAKLCYLVKNKSDQFCKITLLDRKLDPLKIQSTIKEKLELQKGEAKNIPGKSGSEKNKIMKQIYKKLLQDQKLLLVEILDFLTWSNIDQNDVYYNALRILSESEESLGDIDLFLEKMIWRRLYNQDDWKKIVGLADESEEQIEATNRSTLLYNTLSMCIESMILEQDSPLQLLLPSQVECPVDIQSIIEYIYPQKSKAEREALRIEFLEENIILQKNLTHCDYDAWVSSIYNLAKSDLAKPANMYYDHYTLEELNMGEHLPNSGAIDTSPSNAIGSNIKEDVMDTG